MKLSPEILGKSQEFVKAKLATDTDKPVFFVFHGGSGSEKSKIEEALTYGVIVRVQSADALGLRPVARPRLCWSTR